MPPRGARDRYDDGAFLPDQGTVAAAAAVSGRSRAQAAWPPGGTDILARRIAPSLAAALGQPIVVENRGDTSGVIDTAELLRIAPDGHGFGLVTSVLVSAALLSRRPTSRQ